MTKNPSSATHCLPTAPSFENGPPTIGFTYQDQLGTSHAGSDRGAQNGTYPARLCSLSSHLPGTCSRSLRRSTIPQTPISIRKRRTRACRFVALTKKGMVDTHLESLTGLFHRFASVVGGLIGVRPDRLGSSESAGQAGDHRACDGGHGDAGCCWRYVILS